MFEGEHEEAQRRIHTLVQKVQKLENENFELNKKVEKMFNNIEDQKSRHQKELRDRDSKIQKTLKDINDNMEEYQNLMQVRSRAFLYALSLICNVRVNY